SSTLPRPPIPTLFPYTTLFRSVPLLQQGDVQGSRRRDESGGSSPWRRLPSARRETVDGGLRCATWPQGRPDGPAAETAEGEATEDVTWRRRWGVWRKPPDASCGSAQGSSRRGARRSS